VGIKYIDELNLKDKRVFLRVDFNVPLSEDCKVADDTRIKAALPTIQYILENNAPVVIASHLGRPKGKRKKELSLAPVAERLQELLNKRVEFVDECIGEKVETRAKSLKPKEILLLENLRFYPEEEKNDEVFAKGLASLADVYVYDAFAVAHRAHASVEAITRFFSIKGAGFLIKKELTSLEKALHNPERPLVALIGGAKVSGKLEILENLIQRVDKLLIGGGMAFTFLRSMGYEVGKSLVEEELVKVAKTTLEKAKDSQVEIVLPVDFVVAPSRDENVPTKVVPREEIPPEWMGLDIGPQTIKIFSEAIRNSKTVIWNGPMGVFEIEKFAKGTESIVREIANSSAMSVVGGGDTDAALNKTGLTDKITFVSTAGGAFMELLKGSELPAIKALER